MKAKTRARKPAPKKTPQQRQLESYQFAWALELLGKTVEDFQIDERGDLVVFLSDSKDKSEPRHTIEVRVAPAYLPYLDRDEGGPR
jgi:hypothetical protein